MSLVIWKPAFCICKNKGADQLCGNRAADQCFCFCYIDSTTLLLLKSVISSLKPSSVTVQPGLCWTWSETPKTGLLKYNILSNTVGKSMWCDAGHPGYLPSLISLHCPHEGNLDPKMSSELEQWLNRLQECQGPSESVMCFKATLFFYGAAQLRFLSSGSDWIFYFTRNVFGNHQNIEASIHGSWKSVRNKHIDRSAQIVQSQRSAQIVQTQIRLLLEEQSDQGLHCLLFHLHHFDKIHFRFGLFIWILDRLQQRFLASQNLGTLQ